MQEVEAEVAAVVVVVSVVILEGTGIRILTVKEEVSNVFLLVCLNLLRKLKYESESM